MARARPVLFLFLCFLSFGPGLAQEKKGGQTSQPTQPRPSPPAQQAQTSQVEQPIFLTGKVIYADGTPADLAASVKLWCDGRVRRQVHTINGLFSLQMGGGTTHVSSFDAGISTENESANRIGGQPGGFTTAPAGGSGNRSGLRSRTRTDLDLSGCELRAEQAGFQSDGISLTFRRPLDNPEVGTLILYRAGSVSGTTSSVTTMAAPKQARKGFKKASKEVQKKKANYQKAAAELEKATSIYPEFSEAWNLLGEVRLQLKDESGAQEAFEMAAASDPKYLDPQIAMMELESQRSRWDQVSQRSTKVLELHPYHMQAHYYRGVANLNLRHMEQAEESLSTVRASHKADDYPYAGYLLGLMLADKGEFDAAARELKHFLKLVPLAPERARVTGFLSNWEKKGLIGDR